MGGAEIAALEQAGLAAWPAHVTQAIDGWAVRVSGGASKRANSANPLPGAAPVGSIVARVEALYRAAGLPAIFRLSPLAPPDADAALQTAGYVLEQPSWVMTGRTDDATDVAALLMESSPSAEWLTGIAAMDGAKSTPEHEAIARAIRLPAAFATLTQDGVAVGHGLAVADGDRAGLFDIVIAPEARGRGLGRLLTMGLMRWGREQGAGTAWLQVRDGNGPARALYGRLGFADVYPYHYRVKRLA